jgi:excisionase family DNA binding protein
MMDLNGIVITPDSQRRTETRVETRPEWLTVKDVSELFLLTPGTVYSLCRKGQMPHKRIGRSYRFNYAQLIKWAETEEAA